MPDEPEVLGLLALMLLIESRRPARTDAGRRRSCCCADQDRAPLGPRADRRGPGARAALPAPRPARARTRSRPRSTPCTATRRPRRTPTGGRSWRSTTSCSRSRRARSSRSTARSRWPRSTGPAAALALVDALDLDRLPPVPRHPRRPAAPARPRRRGARRPTTRRSRAPTTRPSGTSCAVGRRMCDRAWGGWGRDMPSRSSARRLAPERSGRPCRVPSVLTPMGLPPVLCARRSSGSPQHWPWSSALCEDRDRNADAARSSSCGLPRSPVGGRPASDSTIAASTDAQGSGA